MEMVSIVFVKDESVIKEFEEIVEKIEIHRDDLRIIDIEYKEMTSRIRDIKMLMDKYFTLDVILRLIN